MRLLVISLIGMLTANNKGFTIIELMVATAILGIIGVITASIFLVVVRSSTKSKIIKTLKQKGTFAIGVVERKIRGAEEIGDPNGIETIGDICDGLVMGSISIRSRDGLWTTFTCSASQIASDSANPAILVQNVDIDCSEFALCSFNPGETPKVTINFGLSQGEAEQASSVQFRTTIIPRNY